MTVLKNSRHERFAQALATGKTADEAYVDAGYKPDRGHASRLAANGNIRARVEEIKSRVAEKAEWTAADRLIMLKEIALQTKKDDPRSTIAAIGEANKMQGSYPPTRNEHTGRNGGPIEYANLTEEEIDARIAALGASAGETEPDAEA